MLWNSVSLADLNEIGHASGRRDMPERRMRRPKRSRGLTRKERNEKQFALNSRRYFFFFFFADCPE